MHGMTSVVVGRERVRGETRLHGYILQERAVAGMSRLNILDRKTEQ